MSVLRFPYTRIQTGPSAAFRGRDYTTRPIIPVLLEHRRRSVEVYGLIDSGADTTVFSIEVAKLLRLNPRHGTH